MQINRLRLIGFKSFVEPTDLIVERGLTGVVGPNGCGKSNLLEALRWVMGETSHKSVRAAAMEDVIFSGTAGRPSRNTAEVTIFLDNSARTAPAEYNASDLIEITRHIEREAGSQYRINGREVRARDVRILFEDAATGARSPALVRQGQIGEIVNAKPEQRRRVLEDAAGVAGLHSRRHEAELRLKAADGNLARIADILGQLQSQMDGLKRQARQARRYKEISGEIRKVEAVQLYVAWSEAQAQVDAEEAAFGRALASVAAATEAESRALRAEAALAEQMQPLRETEAHRAAAFARCKSEEGALEHKTEMVLARRRDLEGRAQQLVSDIERETALAAEAEASFERLRGQAVTLRVAEAAATHAEAEARSELAAAEGFGKASEQRLDEATGQVFEARSRATSLTTSLTERQLRVSSLERELAKLAAELREVERGAPEASRLTALEARCAELADALATIDGQLQSADDQVGAVAASADASREALRLASVEAGKLAAERATLEKLLRPAGKGAAPVLDAVKVARGLEFALAAAFGEDLEAPLDPAAPSHWRNLDAVGPDAALPDGVEPLATFVTGPQELTRRLQQTGVVAREMGWRLQSGLKPGQRLVSREGDLWRWDGFIAAAEAATPAAQRLAERNRLEGLARREEAARIRAEAAAATDKQDQQALRAAEERERGLRRQQRETQASLDDGRSGLTAIEQAARDTEHRIAALRAAQARADESLREVQRAVAEATEGLAAAREEVAKLEPVLMAARSGAEAERARILDLRTNLTAIERERVARSERLAANEVEGERWEARTERSRQQVAELERRAGEVKSELDSLAAAIPVIEEQRQKLLVQIEAVERDWRAAGDALAAAETTLREAAQALRASQAALGAEREARARIEARLENARGRRSEEARRIRETIGAAPDGCLAAAGLDPNAALAPLAEVERQLTSLKADRERLGGVNLQAEDDLQTLLAQFQSMDKERADVEEAIAKLRSAIAELNREAKKRLHSAFETVNAHFRTLFTTLFGGGEARLEMIEGEDPLEGGLEIIAKPPGKKPVTLSLLSGGEQSLTALSLIFAVFLTNPSPICVLDEVDAPLDDANVDRFCALMEKMAADTDTRFLVITHHPMTMSRMHRLFGVTMAEKGVSQLVSVDLATAERFIEPVRQQAS